MTLLEVLFVLTILAGTGFVLLAKFPHHLQSQRLAQASTQLLEELRDARQAALAENTWYQVRFYREGKYYQVLRGGVLVRNISLPGGVTFLNRPPDLIFNPTGAPSIGATIVLRAVNGEEKRVIVAPVAGRIREE